jgi:uncharacterized membrane protein YbhN (UPF0104 family)
VSGVDRSGGLSARTGALGGVAAAAAAAGLAAWRFDWAAPLARLEPRSAVPVALALAALIVAGGLKAVVWRAVVVGLVGAGPRVRVRDLLSPVYVGFLGNAILLARVGEPIRLALAHRRLARRGTRLGIAPLVGSAVVEMLIATAVWVALVLVAASVLPLPVYVPAVVAGCGAGGAAVAILAVRSSRVGPRRPAHSAVSRALGAVGAVVSSAGHAIRGLRDPRALPVALAASTSAWLLHLSAVYALTQAFALDVGVAGAASVLVIVTIVQFLPVVPGNIGSFQAAAALPLVASYGVTGPEAVAFGVVFHLALVSAAVLPGLVCLALEDLDMRALRHLRRPSLDDPAPPAQAASRAPGSPPG